MEQGSIESQCAHLLYHSDDVVGLQSLLQHLPSADIYKFPTANVPSTDRTFLMACAKQGRVQCCKLLLSLDSAASVNTQNAQGYTALHYASYQGHIEVAFLLLAAGADWRLCNVHGETAYQTAISGKKYELANRFQLSPYFADNYYPPVSSSGVTMSKHEAGMFKLEIVDVDSGGDKSFIGLDFHCLATTQRGLNSTVLVPNILSGSAFEATGCMLHSSDDLYIGRARSNHVCIADLSLSKQHAVISYFENRGFVVHDIGSKHGTFVNKKRLLVLGADVTNDACCNLTTVHTAQTEVTSHLKSSLLKGSDSMNRVADLAEAKGVDAVDVNQSDHGVGNSAELPSTGAVPTDAANTGDIIATPAPIAPAITHSEYLLEGMLVQFGRIHCKVVRKKQDSIISSGFQPAGSTMREGDKDNSLLQQHHTAVQQRVRALLNVPDHIAVHTSGQASAAVAAAVIKKVGSNNNIATGVTNTVSAGQKRKLITASTPESLLTIPTTEPVLSNINSGVGLELLQKFGWKGGTSLGKHTTQANNPIIPARLQDRAGLGSNTHLSAVMGADSAVGTTIIDEDLDSEKTKAWKRMMARFSEAR